MGPGLEDFLGDWRLDRVIEDAGAQTQATFAGRAVFAPSPGGLAQDECGTLHLPGQPPMMARRRYLWRRGAGGIEVLFEDGRFFHRIGPGTCPEAVHHCPPDRYAVIYDFARWPAWSSLWRVAGPRKAYAMRSSYARDGACTAP